MAIRISNDSVSVVVRGCALDREQRVVWLELAPQHPKAIGAIWADLVQSQAPFLRLRDDETDASQMVRGLGRRYHRLTADAPSLADLNRARPKLLRLIAPEACRIEKGGQEVFYALDWPGVPAATALAAMLERATSTPILLGWADYLLAVALAHEYATPLTVGGQAPRGYRLDPAPWDDLVADGVQAGHITLTGEVVRMPAGVALAHVPQPVEAQ